MTRRNSLSKARSALLATLALLATTVSTVQNPPPSNAACLAGDTSTECIGYYKMPVVDEGDQSGYFDTAEHLSIYAPDVRWVPPVPYPVTYKLARDELVDLQKRVRELPVPVLKGELVYTGTELLGIVPRITAAGRVVIRALNISSLKTVPSSGGKFGIEKKKSGYSQQDFAASADEAEEAHDDLLTNLAEVDIAIGQYLRGDVGAVIATQVQILESLKEADQCFLRLMKAVPAASKVPLN